MFDVSNKMCTVLMDFTNVCSEIRLGISTTTPLISVSLQMWHARLVSWLILHLSLSLSSLCVRMVCFPIRSWRVHSPICMQVRPSTTTKRASATGHQLLVGNSGWWPRCSGTLQSLRRRNVHVWQRPTTIFPEQIDWATLRNVFRILLDRATCL